MEDLRDYKVIKIPARERQDHSHIKRISIKDFPEWAQPAFANTETLNVIQSAVHSAAFTTNKNMLVAAPTGAGKTNIAMMTVLREVHHFVNSHR